MNEGHYEDPGYKNGGFYFLGFGPALAGNIGYLKTGVMNPHSILIVTLDANKDFILVNTNFLERLVVVQHLSLIHN